MTKWSLEEYLREKQNEREFAANPTRFCELKRREMSLGQEGVDQSLAGYRTQATGSLKATPTEGGDGPPNWNLLQISESDPRPAEEDDDVVFLESYVGSSSDSNKSRRARRDERGYASADQQKPASASGPTPMEVEQEDDNDDIVFLGTCARPSSTDTNKNRGHRQDLSINHGGSFAQPEQSSRSCKTPGMGNAGSIPELVEMTGFIPLVDKDEDRVPSGSADHAGGSKADLEKGERRSGENRQSSSSPVRSPPPKRTRPADGVAGREGGDDDMEEATATNGGTGTASGTTVDENRAIRSSTSSSGEIEQQPPQDQGTARSTFGMILRSRDKLKRNWRYL